MNTSLQAIGEAFEEVAKEFDFIKFKDYELVDDAISSNAGPKNKSRLVVVFRVSIGHANASERKYEFLEKINEKRREKSGLKFLNFGPSSIAIEGLPNFIFEPRLQKVLPQEKQSPEKIILEGSHTSRLPTLEQVERVRQLKNVAQIEQPKNEKIRQVKQQEKQKPQKMETNEINRLLSQNGVPTHAKAIKNTEKESCVILSVAKQVITAAYGTRKTREAILKKTLQVLTDNNHHATLSGMHIKILGKNGNGGQSLSLLNTISYWDEDQKFPINGVLRKNHIPTTPAGVNDPGKESYTILDPAKKSIITGGGSEDTRVALLERVVGILSKNGYDAKLSGKRIDYTEVSTSTAPPPAVNPVVTNVFEDFTPKEAEVFRQKLIEMFGLPRPDKGETVDRILEKFVLVPKESVTAFNPALFADKEKVLSEIS